MAVTGIVVLAVSAGTGALGLMMWAVALNGFMGQTRAVDTSLIVYCALAVASVLVATAFSVAAVYYTTSKRGWHAAVSTIVSILAFSTAAGVVQVLAVFVSVIVADQLRTNR